MHKFKYMILGGGVTAGYAAKAFAKAGIQLDELAIISADDHLPYERPPLSKKFLAGDKSKSDILINDEGFYDDHGIRVFLNTRVKMISPEKSTLYTNDDTFVYEKLLACTGSRVKELDIPGADFEGVEYLRSLDDSREIRQKENKVARVVVVGGGYIGMEVASVMRQKNLDVTMVFPHDELMQSHFFTSEMADFFEDYYREKGVKFIKGEKAAEIIGSQGRVKSVRLESGKTIDTDLVVGGIGVAPNIELFKDTSVKTTEEGILVDRYLVSSVSNIYAAGDIASYHDVIFDKRRRIEHWNNAVKQGEYAARAMTGNTHKPYDELPYFFSDIFDLSYEFWGDNKEGDSVVYRGEISADGFSAWWLQENRLVAAFIMGRPDEEREFAQQMIVSGEPVAANMLEDTSQPLNVEASA